MGSTETPSKAHVAWAGGRATPSTSMTVARKSIVTTGSHETRGAGPTTAGHAMMPGTRWPPSQTSRLRPRKGPAEPAPPQSGRCSVPGGIWPLLPLPQRPTGGQLTAAVGGVGAGAEEGASKKRKREEGSRVEAHPQARCPS